MKRTILLTALLSMFGGGFAQAAYIGAIDTENKPFEFSLGANGSYIGMDRKFGDEAVKTAQSVVVGQVNFSVKGWQLGLAGGGVLWEYNKTGIEVKGDAESEMLPYARIDVGGPIFRGEVLTVGPFLQGSYSDGFDDTASVVNGIASGPLYSGWNNPSTGYETMHFDDTLELTAGVRFQVTIEGAQLYGGPAYYWSESEVSSTLTAWDIAGPGSATSYTNFPLGTHKIAVRKLGAIAGVRWPLETGLRLDLEGQWFDGAGISGALSYPF
ncbi:MAG: hypothetical protein A2091_01540 [Desulfuromonadales bacterium GWD2_61_12]|nr:MAG: hypothetical protein A2005_07260 [Desulfuromonadales bacterium GWC2_61_20]OGR35638.1 MAG: hypothetical protein A2091_01540 [Desulfuromonadales bacterium GWD2_61_12]HAD04222.1 hypothetical protein [Desulfuromonas sp.]HBT82170.1 hypothetical protein [Desulfuromonas sp.]